MNKTTKHNKANNDCNADQKPNEDNILKKSSRQVTGGRPQNSLIAGARGRRLRAPRGNLYAILIITVLLLLLLLLIIIMLMIMIMIIVLIMIITIMIVVVVVVVVVVLLLLLLLLLLIVRQMLLTPIPMPIPILILILALAHSPSTLRDLQRPPCRGATPLQTSSEES